MTATGAIRDWFADAADQAVAAASTPTIREGAELFAARIRAAPEVPFEPTTLDVLHAADTVADTPLGERFAALAGQMRWTTSPRWDDGGRERALCLAGDMFELGDVIAGLVYLDAGGTYPRHSHPPQELYTTIAGTGRWRFGGADDLVEVPPGSTLYNNPNDIHAIAAGSTPLVAMFVLWGDGV